MAKFILDGQEYGGGGSGSNIVKLTQAEYDALSNDKLSNDIIYLITDSGELAAENLFYDGSQTGLGNNVQSAIDELNSNMVFPLPDYNNAVSITVLPFTAPDNGIAYFVVGGAGAGGRYFYLNGNTDYLCGCTCAANSYLTMSLILSKGDIVTSNGGIYGIYTFVPFKK